MTMPSGDDTEMEEEEAPVPPGAATVWRIFQTDNTTMPWTEFEDLLKIEAIRLRKLYPCIYDKATGMLTISDDDLFLYSEALGLRTAARMTGEGSMAAGGMVQKYSAKMGPNTETYLVTDPRTKAAGWATEARTTMGLIDCVGGGKRGLNAGRLLIGVNPSRSGGVLHVESPVLVASPSVPVGPAPAWWRSF